MALTSPGVQVSVIDESFYTPAEPGTRPLIIVATAENKKNASGTGTAEGTLAENAGKVFTLTSQRELAEKFGDPTFKVDSNNNPIHAGELNEYGLQAAYSFLGVSNSVLVVRADIDLDAIEPDATAPTGEPVDGTFWLDTATTAFGVFEWDGRTVLAGGQLFAAKTPTVYLSAVPANTVGTAGSYAAVKESNSISIYYKSQFDDEGAVAANGDWVKVGSDAWATAFTIVQGSNATVGAGTTGNVIINGTTVPISADNIAGVAVDINTASVNTNVGARIVSGNLQLFAKDSGIDEIIVAPGTGGGDAALFSAMGLTAGTYPTVAYQASKHTQVPQWKTTSTTPRASGSVWVKTTEPNAGARWRVRIYNEATKLWEQLQAPLYSSDSLATAGIDPTGGGVNLKIENVYVNYSEATATFTVKRWDGNSWEEMPAGTTSEDYYFISSTAPSTLIEDSRLWYSSIVDEVDILVLDVVAGNPVWKGINNHPDYADAEVIISASQPVLTTQQKNQENHLWIDTSDLENYPNLKRWNKDFKKWYTVDVSDQTTENGIVFGDARWATAGSASAPSTISALQTSDFVDFDAPDPALYPQGMLLWNTRRSGFNVKKFVRDYIDVTEDNIRMNNVSMADYYPHRWVTESGNQADGSGSFGRKAQRKVVQQAFQALVNSNEQIRDTERNNFNLLACPGYPELIGEMISLNLDRGLTAFIVGDTPARLTPDATSLNNWATNLEGALEDNDKGLVSSDEYLGVFYPWGFTSSNAGGDIAVPPSHMILRMMALNDQVAYPWFAPAGTRRGGITNATAVGYVTAEGEFQSVALNEGQRDTLYTNKVNPITFFVGAGLVNFGQKTRARNASALDRINVARLVIYLRNQLDKLARPYIFEPNDKITRDEIKQQVESLLVELVGLRALYDFLVVCDESNNTPNRIDRNELYVDIAVEPVKAVEFIYIPVRLKNTGEIAGL